ncbi:MAG: hypothetical protein VW258_10115 [Thalassolituus sp.]
MRPRILAAISIFVIGSLGWLFSGSGNEAPSILPQVSYDQPDSSPQSQSNTQDPHLNKQTLNKPTSDKPAPDKQGPDDHSHDGELSPELEAYLDNMRSDSADIEIIRHTSAAAIVGTATVRTDRQLSTVLVRTIDEDGNKKLVERKITPDGKIIVPE